MNSDLALRIASMVGQWSILTCAILAICWLATIVIRKNASLRHLGWAIGFVAILFAPILTWVVPSRNVVGVQKPALIEMSATADSVIDLTPADFQTADLPTAPREFPWPIPVLLWVGGILLVGSQAGLANLGVRKLRKESTSWRGVEIEPSTLASQMGVKRAWQLRQSSTEKPPAAMTWGFIRPVVLLPRDCSAWSLVRLRATVLHELAHIRRADSLTQRLTLVACALHWFNPAIWLAARALRADAEAAADDAVLRSGVKASDYAAELLGIAAELGGLRQPKLSQGVSIMKDSRIESRIRAIVDPSRRRRGITSLQTLTAVAVGAFSLTALASICPTIAVASPAIDPPLVGMVYQRSTGSQDVTKEMSERDRVIERAQAKELAEQSADLALQMKAAKAQSSGNAQSVSSLKAQIAKLQVELARSNAQLAAMRQMLLVREQKRQAELEILEVRRQQNIDATVERLNATLQDKSRQDKAREEHLTEVRKAMDEAQRKVRDAGGSSEDQKRAVEDLVVQEKRLVEAAQQRSAADLLIEQKRKAERQQLNEVAVAAVRAKLAQDMAQSQIHEREKMLIQQKLTAEMLAEANAVQAVAAEQQMVLRRQVKIARQAYAAAASRQDQAKRNRLLVEAARKKAAERTMTAAKRAQLTAEKKVRDTETARKKAAAKRKG